MPGCAGTPYVLCRPTLPSIGTVSLEPVEASRRPEIDSAADVIETRYYRVRIDRATGALTSLKLKPSGREMLGGPANVIVAEKPKKRRSGDPGDHMVDRAGAPGLDDFERSSRRRSPFERGRWPPRSRSRRSSYGGGRMVRTMRFYDDYPRIDFETELNDIPDRDRGGGGVSAGGGRSRGAARHSLRLLAWRVGGWSGRNARSHESTGWTTGHRARGALVALRSSRADGGVALLDRGLSGRELTGSTPIIFLLNASDKYYGYANAWLSGKGKHRSRLRAGRTRRGLDEGAHPAAGMGIQLPAGRGAQPRNDRLSRSFVEDIGQRDRRGDSPRRFRDIELRMAECLGTAGDAEVSSRYLTRKRR